MRRECVEILCFLHDTVFYFFVLSFHKSVIEALPGQVHGQRQRKINLGRINTVEHSDVSVFMYRISPEW